MKEDSFRELRAAVWADITAERFEQAEVALRKLIDLLEPDDALSLNMFFGLLAGVLNSLDRPDEGTQMYRRALDEARRLRPPEPTVDVARYMLANQYLIYGDPAQALAETDPIPAGCGHVQCLLHAVAAEALWKLGRQDEARSTAGRAIDASPTYERRTQLSEQLTHILG